ncbi:MAG: AAA family ATPase [Candidatus Thorarchaeota archaeon]
MVACELAEPQTEDFGKRIIRLPPEALVILGVEDETVIEVIHKDKRFGVIVKPDVPMVEQSIPPLEREKKQKKSSEDDLPRPRGRRFQGYSEIDRESIFTARLDGEVRQSLGLSLGDLVEVDTILKPAIAKIVHVTLVGRDPKKLDDAERHLLLVQLRNQLKNQPVSSGLQINLAGYTFKKETLFIKATSPDGIVIINPKTTKFQLSKTFIPSSKELEAISWESIGGLKPVIRRLRKLVITPIRRPEVFSAINISPPHGILLVGGSGVGKTLLLDTLAAEMAQSGARIFRIPSNLFAGVGPTEKNIRTLFADVQKTAQKSPALLILDDLDTLTPAPNLNLPEYVRRFSIQFALGLDTLKGTRAFVVGACKSADDIDPIVRRPGRFDIEVECNVPSEQEREEILNIHLRTVPLENDVTEDYLRSYISRMTGYVGTDIAALVKEACMRCVARYAELINLWGTSIPPTVMLEIKVAREDFEEAFRTVEPSALRTVHSRILKPNVHWNDIGGLTEIKHLLQEQLEWQFHQPQVLKEMGVTPPRGILLYGPPGNGKTLLARAIATELEASFISIKGPELLSVWFGESARIVRELFSKAKKLAPCILFFDEIDAMVPRRGGDESDGGREIDATVNQLLTLLDGIEDTQDIFVIGATNRPGALDLALLRPGRLDKLILIPSPDQAGRREILDIHSRKIPFQGERDHLLDSLSERTAGYSGADLENLCREAVMSALRTDFNQRVIMFEHFESALKDCFPSVDSKLEAYYNEFESRVLGNKKGEFLSKQSPSFV